MLILSQRASMTICTSFLHSGMYQVRPSFKKGFFQVASVQVSSLSTSSSASTTTTTTTTTGTATGTATSTATTNSSSTTTLTPTRSQLRILAMRAAIPMLGFGFIDNLTMITAGEAIDATFGVMFGLSTMAAAGFGQCVSDVAGLTGGGVVDATVAKLNLPQHGLTQAQLNGKKARVWTTMGGCIGVVTGCLLGMSCLLFMDTDRAEKAKKAKELNSIFESVVEEGHNLVEAERATLWMVDGDELWSRVSTGTKDHIHFAKNSGVVGACVQAGEVVNVADARKDARFDPDVDKSTGLYTTSILVCPVMEESGKVIGAIQVINKNGKEGEQKGFSDGDVKMIQMLASHVAAFIRIVNA